MRIIWQIKHYWTKPFLQQEDRKEYYMARRDTILVSRTLYQLGALTLVASIMWVGVGVYSALGENLKTSVDPNILTPINPSLDQEVVVGLTSRLKVLQVEPASIQEIEVLDENPTTDEFEPLDDTIEDDGIR